MHRWARLCSALALLALLAPGAQGWAKRKGKKATPVPRDTKLDFRARLRQLSVDPNKVRVTFTTSTGKGGENVNRRKTRVHIDGYGVRVSSQKTRYQHQNRKLAEKKFLEALGDKLDQPRKAKPPARSKKRKKGWTKRRR